MRPPPPPGRGRWREALPPACAAALTAAVVLLLCWPLPLRLEASFPAGRFICSQVWLFDHIFRMLTGVAPLAPTTARLGFPQTWYLPINGWSAGLVAAALRAVLGPWGAYNATLALSPAAATLAAYALVRRMTGASGWTAAAMALAYGLCPTALGALVNHQIDKLQHWILPLGLLLAGAVVRGPGLVGPTLAWMGLIIAGAFSGPDYVLHLSVLVLPWLALEVRGLGAPWRPRLLRAGLVLASAALTAIPPWWYYDPARHATFPSALAPGAPTRLGVAEALCPVADPVQVLLGGDAGHDPLGAVHLVYLGLPALLAAAVLLGRAGRGRAFGLTILLCALLLALGPRLAHDGHHVSIAGVPIVLPAALLEWVHHPLGRSGMYYRFMVAAWLGMVLLLAAGLAAPIRRPSWLAPGLLAWGLAALLLTDSLRSSRALWPRPLVAVDSYQLDRRLAGDPVPGAVLELPLGRHLEVDEAYALQSALVHGRATTGRIIHTVEVGFADEVLLSWLGEAEHAAGPCDARRALARHGLRYAVWRPPGRDTGDDLPRLLRTLGPGEVVGQERYWRLEGADEPCEG